MSSSLPGGDNVSPFPRADYFTKLNYCRVSVHLSGSGRDDAKWYGVAHSVCWSDFCFWRISHSFNFKTVNQKKKVGSWEYGSCVFATMHWLCFFDNLLKTTLYWKQNLWKKKRFVIKFPKLKIVVVFFCIFVNLKAWRICYYGRGFILHITPFFYIFWYLN